MEQEIQRLEQEIADISPQVKALNKNSFTLSSDRQYYYNKKAKLKKELETLREQQRVITSTSEKLTGLDNNLKSKDEIIAKFNGLKVELENQCNDLANKNITLEQQLHQCGHYIKQQADFITETTKARDEAIKNLDKAQTKIKELEQKNLELNATINRMTAEFTNNLAKEVSEKSELVRYKEPAIDWYNFQQWLGRHPSRWTAVDRYYKLYKGIIQETPTVQNS